MFLLSTDTNNSLSRLNMWYYINVKFFKIKNLNYIMFFINNFTSMKLISVRVYKNNFSFNFIYFMFLKVSVLIIITLILF